MLRMGQANLKAFADVLNYHRMTRQDEVTRPRTQRSLSVYL